MNALRCLKLVAFENKDSVLAVAADASALSFQMPRQLSRRLGLSMSFQEREKEGPFSPQRHREVQATRHATAWRGGCAVLART